MENICPPALKRRLESILGDSAGVLDSTGSRQKSVRVNTLKAGVREAADSLTSQGFVLEEIPWIGRGYRVKNPAGLDDTLEYFLGHYYIQDAASMLPAEVLNPEPGDVALDLCAAPGGKTTQMSELMENEGVLVANEHNPRRIGSLKFNLSKHGVVNAVVTRMDAARRWDCRMKFDKILLDAPCSCEGQVGNPEAAKTWSLRKVVKCSRLQKRMIENAAKLLAEEGVLVYSTCTLAPEENEEVVDHLLGLDEGLIVESMEVKGLVYHEGLEEWEGRRYSSEVKKCLRIHPKENNTEGFFIAKLRKT